jgi:hypothetical protein
MNQYIRKNNFFPISDNDIKLFNELVLHPDSGQLVHHTIKDSRVTRTDFVKNMIRLGKLLNLKVSSISAFTGKPGTHCLPHIDGDQDNNYAWRVAYYTQGEPATLNWYKNTNRIVRHQVLDTSNKRIDDANTPTGYTVVDTNEVIYHEVLNMHSAFVRTDVPHSLDMTQTITPRLTISATFFPHISWEELNSRIDKLTLT